MPLFPKLVRATITPAQKAKAQEIDGRIIACMVADKNGRTLFSFVAPVSKREGDALYRLHNGLSCRKKAQVRSGR